MSERFHIVEPGSGFSIRLQKGSYFLVNRDKGTVFNARQARRWLNLRAGGCKLVPVPVPIAESEVAA